MVWPKYCPWNSLNVGISDTEYQLWFSLNITPINQEANRAKEDPAVECPVVECPAVESPAVESPPVEGIAVVVKELMLTGDNVQINDINW